MATRHSRGALARHPLSGRTCRGSARSALLPSGLRTVWQGQGVLWPVLVDREPMDPVWRVGSQVSIPLVWQDDPHLDELLLRDVEFEVTTLPGGPSAPVQLLRRGRFVAVRRADDAGAAGLVRLSGLPAWHRYASLVLPPFPSTSGVIRRVQVVHRLHDRREDRWSPVAGSLRVVDVADTSATRLRPDPPNPPLPHDTTGTHAARTRVLTVSEYLREFGDLLPAQQWQGVGFLAQLDVAD